MRLFLFFFLLFNLNKCSYSLERSNMNMLYNKNDIENTKHHNRKQKTQNTFSTGYLFKNRSSFNVLTIIAVSALTIYNWYSINYSIECTNHQHIILNSKEPPLEENPLEKILYKGNDKYFDEVNLNNAIKYKLLFQYHIPKTAGMTIRKTLPNFLNIRECKIYPLCKDEKKWRNDNSKKLISYLNSAKKNKTKCNFISMELLRKQGQLIDIDSYEDNIYLFTFLREPQQQTISSIVHDVKMNRFKGFDLTKIINFKLNKSDFINRKNSGYSLYNGNFQTNRLINQLDFKNNFSIPNLGSCKNNFYLNTKLDFQKLEKIKLHIEDTFNFIGITEYFHESLCLLLYDLYTKYEYSKLSMNEITNFCNIKCNERTNTQKTRIKKFHDSLSTNIFNNHFISPSDLKKIHSLNKIDQIIYSYSLNKFLSEIFELEKKLNISIIC